MLKLVTQLLFEAWPDHISCDAMRPARFFFDKKLPSSRPRDGRRSAGERRPAEGVGGDHVQLVEEVRGRAGELGRPEMQHHLQRRGWQLLKDRPSEQQAVQDSQRAASDGCGEDSGFVNDFRHFHFLLTS